MKVDEGERRYALLQAAKDSDYVKKFHGGYLNVFAAALGGDGDKWDVFHVVNGEFPALNDLDDYEGFVVSGSPHDAYGDEYWVLELCFLLQTLFAMQKKVLGVCFGHQMLCRALGGKVAKSYSGWDIGVRKVNFTHNFYSFGLCNEDEEIPPALSIIECHQDEVWEVPIGAQVLAWSDKTGVEMFTFGDNILGIQGHPEYTKDILDNLIDRLITNNSIEVEKGERRYALLQAAKDSDYVKKFHGGYLNVFAAALGGDGDKWDVFHVIDGDFPPSNDLDGYEGFVISGSPHDAYSNEYWVLELCYLLQTLFAMQKKVLGVCFGHQMLCRALGGRVAKSYSGWDIGVRKVNFTQDFYSFGLCDEDEEIPPALSIIECHQDEVWEVPTGAHVLAWSDKTGVEMFTFGDKILGIQGHPEYTKDILDNLIDRLLTNNSIERDLGEEAKMQLVEAEPDRKYWEKICKGFLKGKRSQLQSCF